MFGMGAATPLPDSETLALGVSGSSESTRSVEPNGPAEDGLNCREPVHFCPAGTVGDVVPQGRDPPFAFRVKLETSDSTMLDTCRAAAPLFDRARTRAGDTH